MSKLVLLAVLCLFCASISSSPCPLERYVERRDRSFTWSLVNTVAGNLSTTYILNLTSQTWLTAADSDTPVWRHWLAVCVPNTVSYRTALMWIDSGRNTDAAPSTIEPLMQATCDTSNSIVASVGQIPNQPITFSDGVTRVEDDLLGYTWVRFLQNTSKPEWIGRLPMTKAVVKAMDAVEDFVQDQSIRIKNWVISGASKRGWAAWTTAAIDNRVVAVIPVVIPILNMAAVIKNHYQSYGEWSFTFQPYINAGAIAYLDTPEFLELEAIDDPLSYKRDLNMPKYIITATGDEFFPPDSTKFFFDKLKGENHLRVLPNTEHALIGAESITATAIKNYYQTILTKEKRPKISWQIVRSNTTASITVRLRDNKVPVQVRLYQSQTLSTTQRDFRLLVCPDPATCWRPVYWIPSVLSPVPSHPKYYTATVSAPAAGWVGFFIEVEYALGAQATQFVISSEVNIVPDRLPFPPCSDCV